MLLECFNGGRGQRSFEIRINISALANLNEYALKVWLANFAEAPFCLPQSSLPLSVCTSPPHLCPLLANFMTFPPNLLQLRIRGYANFFYHIFLYSHGLKFIHPNWNSTSGGGLPELFLLEGWCYLVLNNSYKTSQDLSEATF